MFIMYLILEIENCKKERERSKRKVNARELSLEGLENFSRLMILMRSKMKDLCLPPSKIKMNDNLEK